MKLQEKEIAIKLRRQGFPYNAIRKQLHVSKSSLTLWLRDLHLSESSNKKLLKGRELSRYTAAQKRRAQREQKTQDLIQQGKGEFRTMLKNPLFLAGLCLYWAEGDKHKQERVKFTNADENMIEFMMKWFREVCDVPEDKFRISLHLHSLHIAPDARSHWSKITGVPEAQFEKIFVKPTSLRHRRNVLYNGTCGIIVHNKALFRRICGWKLGLFEHFGLSPRSLMDKTPDF